MKKPSTRELAEGFLSEKEDNLSEVAKLKQIHVEYREVLSKLL